MRYANAELKGEVSMKTSDPNWSRLLDQVAPYFGYWEKIGDAVDQFIDIMVNYRQSGHPGALGPRCTCWLRLCCQVLCVGMSATRVSALAIA